MCFKQETAYEMRISDWSSDVCSSDLQAVLHVPDGRAVGEGGAAVGGEGGGVALAALDLLRCHLVGDGRAHLARLRVAAVAGDVEPAIAQRHVDRKSTRLNSSH